MSILPLEVWLEGIIVVFGTIRSVIVSCAGIAAFAMAGLRARRWRRCLDCFLEGLSSVVLSPSPSFGVSTMYMSYDEVAVQRPVGGGSL